MKALLIVVGMVAITSSALDDEKMAGEKSEKVKDKAKEEDIELSEKGSAILSRLREIRKKWDETLEAAVDDEERGKIFKVLENDEDVEDDKLFEENEKSTHKPQRLKRATSRRHSKKFSKHGSSTGKKGSHRHLHRKGDRGTGKRRGHRKKHNRNSSKISRGKSVT